MSDAIAGEFRRRQVRVVLRAHFDTISGYGNEACDVATALKRAGVDVTLMPLSVTPPIPVTLAYDLHAQPIPPWDVELWYSPPFDLCGFDRGGGCKPIRRMAQRRVLWTMWERDAIARHELDGWRWPLADLGDAPFAALVDELWVPCPMNVDAFRFADPSVPIRVMPSGVDPDRWPRAERDWTAPLRFLVVGTGERKDPWPILKAWDRARPPGATLTIKTLGRNVHPAVADRWPGVTVLNRPLPEPAMLDLYQSHHVLLSTSRGEGIDKPGMEMCSTGGITATSTWDGRASWTYPGVHLTIDGDLCPARRAPWAREWVADVDSVAETLRWCHDNRADLRARAKRAHDAIVTGHTWDHAMRRVVDALEEHRA